MIFFHQQIQKYVMCQLKGRQQLHSTVRSLHPVAPVLLAVMQKRSAALQRLLRETLQEIHPPVIYNRL